MRSLHTIMLVFLFLPLRPVAQKKFKLPDCYKILLQNNLSVQRAQNQVNTDLINKRVAQNSRLPATSFDLGHYFSFGKNIDPVTNGFVNEAFSGGYMSVGLQVKLFSGFYSLYAIKQSEYVLKASEFSKKSIALEKLSDLMQAYARLLFDKEQSYVERSNIEATTKELEIVNEKIRVGKLSRNEYYLLAGRLYSEQANLVAVQNDSSTALLDLKQLLNISYKEEIDIENIDTTALSAISGANISSTSLTEMILQKHPAIKEAEMNEQAARMGERMARSGLYPSLFAGGNLVSNYNVNQRSGNGQKLVLDRQLNNNLGQNISVSLHVPIFTRMEVMNRIRKEKLNIDNMQDAVKETENLIIRNSLQFMNDFNAARQKYTATYSALQLNNLSFSMYEEKYKLGQVSSLELITARDLLNTARSKYLQSKMELYFKYQLLELLQSDF